MDTCTASSIDDCGAFFERQRHRLLNEKMLAMLCRKRCMSGVQLMRRCYINHLDRRIDTKLFNRGVRAGGKLLGKALSCVGTRVRCRHQVDAWVGLKRRQHHGKCAPEAGYADAQLVFACGAQAPTLDKIADILYSDLR